MSRGDEILEDLSSIELQSSIEEEVAEPNFLEGENNDNHSEIYSPPISDIQLDGDLEPEPEVNKTNVTINNDSNKWSDDDITLIKETFVIPKDSNIEYRDTPLSVKMDTFKTSYTMALGDNELFFMAAGKTCNYDATLKDIYNVYSIFKASSVRHAIEIKNGHQWCAYLEVLYIVDHIRSKIAFEAMENNVKNYMLSVLSNTKQTKYGEYLWPDIKLLALGANLALVEDPLLDTKAHRAMPEFNENGDAGYFVSKFEDAFSKFVRHNKDYSVEQKIFDFKSLIGRLARLNEISCITSDWKKLVDTFIAIFNATKARAAKNPPIKPDTTIPRTEYMHKSERTQFGKKRSIKRTKFTGTCSHCNTPGHSSDRCWSNPSARNFKAGFVRKFNTNKPVEAKSVKMVTIDVAGISGNPTGVLDSGSEISIISRNLLSEEDKKRISTLDSVPIVDANGGTSLLNESVNKSLDLPSYDSTLMCSFNFKFFVSDKLNNTILLGTDFLKSTKAIIDVCGKKAKLCDSNGKFIIVKLNDNCKVDELNKCKMTFNNNKATSVFHTTLGKVEVEYDNVFDKIHTHAYGMSSNTFVRKNFGRKDDPPNTTYLLCHYTHSNNDIDISPSDSDVEIQTKFPSVLSDYTEPPPNREGMDMEINTIGDTVPKPRFYPIPRSFKDKAEVTLRELVARGFIRPPNSPFSSPVVCAIKPDNSIRLCCDYQALNSITIRDLYPLPRINEMLYETGGIKIMSKIDLKFGFWQLRIKPGHEFKIPNNSKRIGKFSLDPKYFFGPVKVEAIDGNNITYRGVDMDDNEVVETTHAENVKLFPYLKIDDNHAFNEDEENEGWVPMAPAGILLDDNNESDGGSGRNSYNQVNEPDHTDDEDDGSGCSSLSDYEPSHNLNSKRGRSEVLHEPLTKKQRIINDIKNCNNKTVKIKLESYQDREEEEDCMPYNYNIDEHIESLLGIHPRTVKEATLLSILQRMKEYENSKSFEASASGTNFEMLSPLLSLKISNDCINIIGKRSITYKLQKKSKGKTSKCITEYLVQFSITKCWISREWLNKYSYEKL
eukprot:gene6828-8469_t